MTLPLCAASPPQQSHEGTRHLSGQPLVLPPDASTATSRPPQQPTHSQLPRPATCRYPHGLLPASLLGHNLPGYTFNAGGCCSAADTDGPHRPDDVAFARALVAHVAGLTSINLSRVYSTGFSNGGFMSYRLGCEAPDLVAAVAPVSAVLANGPNEVMQSTERFQCNTSRPVPLLHIHGTADQLVGYTGDPLFGWDSVTASERHAANGRLHSQRLCGKESPDFVSCVNHSRSREVQRGDIGNCERAWPE